MAMPVIRPPTRPGPDSSWSITKGRMKHTLTQKIKLACCLMSSAAAVQVLIFIYNEAKKMETIGHVFFTASGRYPNCPGL